MSSLFFASSFHPLSLLTSFLETFCSELGLAPRGQRSEVITPPEPRRLRTRTQFLLGGAVFLILDLHTISHCYGSAHCAAPPAATGSAHPAGGACGGSGLVSVTSSLLFLRCGQQQPRVQGGTGPGQGDGRPAAGCCLRPRRRRPAGPGGGAGVLEVSVGVERGRAHRAAALRLSSAAAALILGLALRRCHGADSRRRVGVL